MYCRYCFEEQSRVDEGRLSKVYVTSTMTSSGNHLNHAVFKHGKTFEQPVSSKVTNWVHTVQNNKPAQSQFEFNRDLCLLICLDLKPFSSVERSGFKSFCSKNTAFQPPSSDCISGPALKNVYTSVKQRVLEVHQEES